MSIYQLKLMFCNQVNETLTDKTMINLIDFHSSAKAAYSILSFRPHYSLNLVHAYLKIMTKLYSNYECAKHQQFLRYCLGENSYCAV